MNIHAACSHSLKQQGADERTNDIIQACNMN